LIFPENPNAIPEEEEHAHDLPAEGDEDEEKHDEEKDGNDEEGVEEADEDDQGFTKQEREETSEIYNKSAWYNVFRSKGMVFLSSQPDQIFTWQTSGIMCETRYFNKWQATKTKEELIDDGRKEEYESWNDKIQGDRKTELVIIGSGIDKAGVTKL